jgi:hypothetical protein
MIPYEHSEIARNFAILPFKLQVGRQIATNLERLETSLDYFPICLRILLQTTRIELLELFIWNSGNMPMCILAGCTSSTARHFVCGLSLLQELVMCKA